jgi:hypothetical protein
MLRTPARFADKRAVTANLLGSNISTTFNTVSSEI